jgi:hypothetical protein
MLAVNEGSLDRVIRFVLGIVFMIVGFAAVGGGGGLALGLIGVIVLITGITGRCLLYKLFNFNTLGV